MPAFSLVLVYLCTEKWVQKTRDKFLSDSLKGSLIMDSKQLKSLSDDQLTLQVQKLVSDERRITTELLWHLREVESRMLYAKRGFPSLFEYCTKSLGVLRGRRRSANLGDATPQRNA